MHSDRVEYSKDSGTYCMAHDVKVTFYIVDFSSSKIISHQFHINNNEGKLVIAYAMIIDRELMVKLGLFD